MKVKLVIISLIFIMSGLSTFGFELDMSVDDEIRKNYNPSAIENSLPSLPKVQPTSSENKKNINSQPVSNLHRVELHKVNNLPVKTDIDKTTAIRIKKGTKFKVKSSANISDYTAKGAKMSFTTLYPVGQRYFTVPQGTVFKAVIADSHQPQISGNGGLIKVNIESVNYKGYSYKSDGKVTKANGKKIFINNIKGQRKYLKNIAGQIGKGQKFYKKSRSMSNKLTDNPITLIIAPIPTIVGIGGYAVNLVGSPVIAICKKGGHISIPAGSEFEIKLLEDIYLEN